MDAIKAKFRKLTNSSPASATKKDSQPQGWLSFLVMGKRLEEGGGSCKTSAKKCPVDTFFSPGKSPSMPDGIRYGCWLTLIFLPGKVAEKTGANHLTHTLTHHGLDSSGQDSTKQHLPTHKSKKLTFQNFFQTDWVNHLCPQSGLLKRNRLPTEANQALLSWAVCVLKGV